MRGRWSSAKYIVLLTFNEWLRDNPLHSYLFSVLKQQSMNVGKPSSVSPLLAKATYLCAYLLVQAACSVKYKYDVRSVTQCSLDRILSCVAKNGFRPGPIAYSLSRRSVWENLDRGREYRTNAVRSLHMTEVKIFPPWKGILVLCDSVYNYFMREMYRILSWYVPILLHNHNFV